MKELFLLDPNVAFFNHGSFGACPRPIFEKYQDLQRELERQPVEFLIRRFPDMMFEARSALAGFVGCAARDLVFVPNATTGVNTVARSMHFEAGDEILTTDLEYGALDRMWSSVAQSSGAVYRRVPTSFPLTTHEAFVDHFWSHVNPKTRVIFISHISSATGLVLPAQEITNRARNAGIPVMVDGAHVPGQLDLNLSEFGADFYTGNCHKWMMTPKGSAFLHVRRERQETIKPLVVSWGNMSREDSRFIQEHEFQGTRDISAYLAIPKAIAFFRDHQWVRVRERCRATAMLVRALFEEVFENSALAPSDAGWYAQLVAHEVPVRNDRLDLGPLLQRELYNRHRVEIPVTELDGKVYIRASLQAYNDEDDLRRLKEALTDVWGAIAGET